jgi:hypothetical protein
MALRGKSLSIVIGLVGAVGFVLQGYDQAVANGLLTLGSFIAVFPQIDTVHTTGSQKSHNSTIQGMCLFWESRHNISNPAKAQRSLFMKLDVRSALVLVPF